jgi:hypothetical protein
MTAANAATVWGRAWLVLCLLALAAAAAVMRPAASQDAEVITLATPEELDELVGPIALYPDDLVAIVLPASTYPLQVVEAARFLDDRARDSSLDPQEDWDDSVVALLNYPEVIDLLNDDLDWMYDLGAAVLNQRADVLDAIQRFRDRAYDAGNLRSDDRQTVTRADRTIAIRPSDPEVIYVPYYEPEYVVVYQPYPVYHYYPRRYPVYYYPYPASYVFDTGFFWGVRSWFSIGWHTHFLHVYDYGYYSHPYYGWRYYDPWYVRNVYVNVNIGNGYVWEPRHRYGGRPVVRGYEGRVYTADQPPRSSGTTSGSTYRSRTTEGQARTSGGGMSQAREGNSAARSSVTRGTTTTREGTYRSGGGMSQARQPTSQTRQPSAQSGNTNSGAVATREGSYRSGGGMSQARQPSVQTRQPSVETRQPNVQARQPGVQTRQPSAERGNSGAVITREGSYRGGGMSQAREPSPQARSLGSAPSMSREAPRSVEAPQRSSSGGGDNGGGSYRGGDSGGGSSRGGDSGGGSYRGGGGDRGGGGRAEHRR